MFESFPDVAKSPVSRGTRLDKVGMSDIEVPVKVTTPGQRHDMLAMARAAAYVSLDNTAARGIHMSRLYLALQESLERNPLNFLTVHDILQNFLKSHEGISESAYLRIQYEQPLKRRALVTNNMGWRSYPVTLEGTLNGHSFDAALGIKILYSSTCPCSAALARQAIQKSFANKFKSADPINKDEALAWLGTEEGVNATPHGQRSEVVVNLVPKSPYAVDLESLIDAIEDALQTPVQSAVKREDEQEFAVRNASNLMFAEDAARRVKAALDKRPDVKHFTLECKHIESLHPHNAVAMASKDT
jgi:GTP cyclohydrolase I